MRVDRDAKFSARCFGDDVADVGIGKWSTLDGGPEGIVGIPEQDAPMFEPAVDM
jgi:hypothetical protein